MKAAADVGQLHWQAPSSQHMPRHVAYARQYVNQGNDSTVAASSGVGLAPIMP